MAEPITPLAPGTELVPCVHHLLRCSLLPCEGVEGLPSRGGGCPLERLRCPSSTHPFLASQRLGMKSQVSDPRIPADPLGPSPPPQLGCLYSLSRGSAHQTPQNAGEPGDLVTPQPSGHGSLPCWKASICSDTPVPAFTSTLGPSLAHGRHRRGVQ